MTVTTLWLSCLHLPLCGHHSPWVFLESTCIICFLDQNSLLLHPSRKPYHLGMSVFIFIAVILSFCSVSPLGGVSLTCKPADCSLQDFSLVCTAHPHGALGGLAFYQHTQFGGEIKVASASQGCSSENSEMPTQDWAPRGMADNGEAWCTHFLL